MRFVQGRTLSDAIRDYHRQPTPLGFRELLQRFVSVCQTVAYAHSQGVIHRDLKPANVMLGDYGETLVVDWGLAKRLTAPPPGPALPNEPSAHGTDGPEQTTDYAPAQTDDGPLTQAGQVLGTPAYMAPEQAAGDIEGTGKPADIYSLGAILYEQLTGQPPYQGKNMAEVLAAVRLGRLSPPTQIRRGIPRALEAVCSKALAHEIPHRYAAATDVAQDVNRWLADEPVACYGEPLLTRAGRWTRKHKPLVAALLAVLSTMTVGLAMGLLVVNAEKNRTELARQGEENQRIEAQKQTEQAKKKENEAVEREVERLAVLDFVRDKIFAAASPEGQNGGLGRDVSLRRALEEALPHVETSFKDRPLVQAHLRYTMGVSFRQLGLWQSAVEQLQKARLIYTQHRDRGPNHRSTLASMYELATCYSLLGRHAEALQRFEETLALQKAELGPADRDTLLSMLGVAQSYHKLGRHADAVRLQEETLVLQRANLGRDHPDTLATMTNLAASFDALDRHADAVKLIEQAVGLQKAKLGPNHSDTLHSMTNLANSYFAIGRQADAIKLREEVFALAKTQLGRDHPVTLLSMNNLADSYNAQSRHTDALELVEEALGLQKAKLGPDHPDTLLSMTTQAETLIQLDRSSEAVPIIDECIRRASGKAVHPLLIPTVMDLRLRHFQKKKDVAGCRATAEMWEKLKRIDPESLYTAACMWAVTAAVLRATDKSEAAAKDADADADKAMAWLKQAVAVGYKNVAHMKKDKDLDALRKREDLTKLLPGLEAGKGKGKQ